MRKIPSLTKRQMDLLTEIQEGYEKRIRNQRDSINRLLDRVQDLEDARFLDEKCDHSVVTSDSFEDGRCDLCGAQVKMIWVTKVVLAESEELKGEEMSNEQLPDETADLKEPVTGEHDRDFGEADPKETHVQATEVVEEDEDTELSDDQSTKLDSQ